MLVWLPPSYATSERRRYPLVVYLHGLWGNETNWVTLGAINAALDSLVEQQGAEFVVAMPDGDDGWYTTWNSLGDVGACRREFKDRDGDTVDTYCVPWLHYDDYIARDVVGEVQRRYRTDARREKRAIAGLSMGGYGAVTLALAYPDVFSAAASHSGVLSPLYDGGKPFSAPARYASSIERLQTAFGPRFWPLIAPAFGPDTAAWWSRDPARRARSLWQRDRRRMPALFLDIGTEDGLLEQNRAFRHELITLGVPHEYHEWPGEHDWPYWKRHVHESLRFLARQVAGR
jgi:S-formylglutathione hydrolase FrmB